MNNIDSQINELNCQISWLKMYINSNYSIPGNIKYPEIYELYYKNKKNLFNLKRQKERKEKLNKIGNIKDR